MAVSVFLTRVLEETFVSMLSHFFLSSFNYEDNPKIIFCFCSNQFSKLVCVDRSTDSFRNTFLFLCMYSFSDQLFTYLVNVSHISRMQVHVALVLSA